MNTTPTPVDRTKYMDAQEVRLLRQSTELHAARDQIAGRKAGPLAWAVVDLALQTGLRVSEMARLKVGDFDPKRNALTVTRSKKAEAKPETMALGQGLTDHLVAFLAWKESADQDTTAEAALFTGQRGRLTVFGLQQIWKAEIRRAGLPKALSIHSARHTAAVHLLKGTGNLRQVQKQLGHASPVTTANMYADVAFDEMAAGMDGLYTD